MTETWKPIPGYEGRYEVSDQGRVFRVKRYPLKNIALRRNYQRVILYLNGARHYQAVHRLVAAAFIGKCPDGYVVNHLDGNPANNCASNLEYTTQRENIRHAFRVLKRPPHHRGETTHFAKLSDNDVIQIRHMRLNGWTYKAIAAEFNTKPANVWHICKNRTWKHLL